MTVIDHEGIVLARVPNSRAWVGRSAKEAPIGQTILREGEFAWPASKGERPEDGFTLHVHPYFAAQLDRVPYLVLYHLVTGTYPVKGETFSDIRQAHQQGHRTLLRDERPDLPDPFVKVVERALDRDPLRRFESARYDDPFTVRPHVKATFHDAGHILGSAAIRLTVTARGSTTTLLFSGDLGRKYMPILRAPESPPPCDVLIIESTYGDRVHEEDNAAMRQKAEEFLCNCASARFRFFGRAPASRRGPATLWRHSWLQEPRDHRSP